MDSEMIWKQFGEWFKEKRRLANLTQEETARRAGITRQHLGSIEKGESGAKRDTVTVLAQAISVDVQEALNRAGFVTPDGRPDSLRGVPGTIIIVPPKSSADPAAPATKGDIDELKRYVYEMVKQARMTQNKTTGNE